MFTARLCRPWHRTPDSCNAPAYRETPIRPLRLAPTGDGLVSAQRACLSAVARNKQGNRPPACWWGTVLRVSQLARSNQAYRSRLTLQLGTVSMAAGRLDGVAAQSARRPAQPRQPAWRRTLRQTERQRRRYAWGHSFGLHANKVCSQYSTISRGCIGQTADIRLTYRGGYGGNY